MKILFVHNQFDQNNQDIYKEINTFLEDNYKIQGDFLFWSENAKNNVGYNYKKKSFSFEAFIRDKKNKKKISIKSFLIKYKGINWSRIISSERAFTDYSMLLGSTGNRIENLKYVQNLVINITNFLDFHLRNKAAVVCQPADTLFSHILIKLAKFFNIKVFIIVPCFLYEGNEGGGYFADDEYLCSEIMKSNYSSIKKNQFSNRDLIRIKEIKNKIINFKNKTPMTEIFKGSNPGLNAFSPNIKNIFPYLIENINKDKEIIYTKISITKKIKANILRFYRKNMSQILNLYGSSSLKNLPSRNVFYAMHFQPEQSTLTQGNWYLNQIALIENISKSLPLNYSLVVKEHPWGRGIRPLWQYKYISNFHNVVFCDAPSKEIIKKTDAVLSITGSILIEAMVLGKPAIMFGSNFFEYSKLVYKIKNISDLPKIFYDILILNKTLSKEERKFELNKFILSYINSLISTFPIKGNGVLWAKAMVKKLKISKNL